jgi:hypothetical protein
LASDIIESYRHLVERTALTALSIKVIQLDDFRYEDNQIRLGSEARKKYLTLLEKRFLKETDGKDIWQCLHQQGESLWGNINHHSPYLPLMESKVG